MSSLNQNVIRHKIGLLNLAVELCNVSKACKVMGLSRDAFYRYQNAVAEGGVDALFDSNRRKPNPKNRVDEATEIAVLAYAIEQPAHGQVRVSNELRRRGIFVSPSGVRSIGLRHELSSFKLRLVALEKQVAEKGIVLSDDQVAALERKQDDDLAHGEIETAHPGYLGSQDTFYVGTIKGVGRIYQQTFAPAAETAANEESRTVSGSESGDMNGILFVLKTGIRWNHLPTQLGFGSGATCWRRLRDWHKAGVGDRLHELLLAKLRAADQIDFSRAAVDSSSVRAVGAGQKLAEPH